MLPDHIAAELSEEIDRLLRQVDIGLSSLQLRQIKRQPEILSDLFRSAHTLKAVFSTGGYDDRAARAHAFESILGSLRLGNRELDDATFATLMDMARVLASNPQGGESIDFAGAEILNAESQKGRSDARKSDASLMDQLQLSSEVRSAFTEFEDHRLAENLRLGRKVFEIRVELSSKTFDKELASLREQLGLFGEVVSVLPEPSAAISHVDFRLIFASTESLISIRNRIKRQLEISEVASKTGIAEASSRTVNRSLSSAFEILGIAAERMADSLGKQVETRKLGESTIVSSGLLEVLREPMLHLVRNAVAHGIEAPSDRKKLRKPAKGRLTLYASIKRHSLVVEISDDGAGMDPRAIMRRAVQLGYVKADSRLPRAEQLELIFLSGFSTTLSPDLSSGMGIGLDVAARSIGKAGGEISIKSRPGKGTTFRIRIPTSDSNKWDPEIIHGSYSPSPLTNHRY